MTGITPTIIDHKPQRWQAQCPRCGYFHKGLSADVAREEAERCERICLNHGVPLKAHMDYPYRHQGDRIKLADKKH